MPVCNWCSRRRRPQSAGCNKITDRIGRRNPVACCQGSKLHGAADKKCIGSNEEGIGALARKGSKGRIDLSDCRGVEDLNLQPDAGGRFLHVAHCGLDKTKRLRLLHDLVPEAVHIAVLVDPANTSITVALVIDAFTLGRHTAVNDATRNADSYTQREAAMRICTGANGGQDLRRIVPEIQPAIHWLKPAGFRISKDEPIRPYEPLAAMLRDTVDEVAVPDDATTLQFVARRLDFLKRYAGERGSGMD